MAQKGKKKMKEANISYSALWKAKLSLVPSWDVKRSVTEVSPSEAKDLSGFASVVNE